MNKDIYIEKILMKSGDETLKVNDFLIHSKYNPKLESEKLAEKYYVPHHVHIVFGYGCGYLVDALIDRFQFNERLIVIDPLLDNGKIKVKKSHENLIIFNSTVIEDFNIHLQDFAEEIRTSFQVFCLTNYDKIFPELYKKVLQKIKDVQMSNRTNDLTLILFAEQWQKNFIDNLFNLNKDCSLNLLHKSYSCPIVIASGGPSLSKQIPMLKKIRDSIIIIAAGTTIHSLIAEGIYPDYVVSVDPAKENYETFENLYFNNTKIIYTLLNHPRVRDSFKQSGYVVDTSGWGTFSRYIRDELNIEVPILLGGASVANLVFSIAQYITTGPIAFIGQDLAYTNNVTHATYNSQAREVDVEVLKAESAFKVEGYYDDSVWTTPPLYAMKLDFEKMIKRIIPEVLFFNCTEGGVKINGFPQMPFAEFCAQYVTNEKVEIKNHDASQQIQLDVNEVLQKKIKLYEKLIRIFTSGLIELSSNRSNTYFEQRVLRELDKIEEKSQKLLKQLPIESIVSPITMKVMRGYLPRENEEADEKYKRIYNQTKDLYTEMIQAIKKTKNYCNEVFEKHKSEELE
ncbi:motility associated factor glycosyltransferase family protein [Lysinibacillus sp. NPDC093190]|uniref:motility associated factor glycosyltransferase family protein n=1 Tax=Lysinibacillus sp. NPDC093190 TaxID=3390575 RepID=UPI003D073355